MTIPVGNIYYLLLYAWRHVQRRETVAAGTLPTTSLRDLLAHLLAHDVRVLIARGLAREYVTDSDAISGLRGKLDIGATIKLNLLPEARTFCHYDDLQRDIPRNQIIKATLRTLLRLTELDPTVRASVRRVYGKLEGIADIRLTRHHFGGLQAHRQVREYAFSLQLCLLIFDSVVMEQGAESARFVDFREDDAQMARLFEGFVLEFYRREAPAFTVHRPQIRWFEAKGADRDLAHLPIMQTDVVLDAPDRTIVLDAKFYREALRERFGHDRLRSSHLYQIFSYLENRTAALPGRPHEGMLLYPVVEKPFAFSYRLKGHSIKVRSIDLTQPWQQIERDMLALIA